MSKKKIPTIRSLAFIEARERLGLSTEVLALSACLSKKQIEQIENGEQSAFYSAALKLRSAQKVATILGLEEADYLEVEIEAPPAPAAVVLSEPEPTPTLAPTPLPVLEIEIEIEKDKVSTPILKPGTAPTDLQIKDKQRKLFLYASVAAAFVFAIIHFGNDVVTVSAPVPAAPLVAAPALIKEEPSPAPEPTPVAMIEPNAKPTAVVSDAACPKPENNPVMYKTGSPSKAGDMVYVQSLSQQVVCVIDAAGKEQSKTLEAGASYSFYGAPPFKLLTANLAQTEIFFQGLRVRPSNPEAKTLILEETKL
jgi:transcriptional regulator with XRE-family HTH domain